MPVQQAPDPRVQRSRTALETALRDLLRERDLTQIQILDVTRRAGVNRSTFYEHYRGMDELAASACAAMFDALIAAAPVIGPAGDTDPARATAALTSVFTHVAENAGLYQALAGEGGSGRLINHMHWRLTVAIHVNFHGDFPRTDHTSDPADIPHAPQAALLAGALLGAILDWLRHGCPGSAAQLSATIWPLLAAISPAAMVNGQPRSF
ncbi:TetR/AcrR family transcriptional regulator [Nonomuraea sp. NPDC050404]|uniref:TetR/AcrR family transcriptional regulator n=1 Tax=Nonomuraea sp. NPDC050404 TaxID=3155783 RepID=UPI00340605AF